MATPAFCEGEIARKPATISQIEAGVLPLAGLAAWESLGADEFIVYKSQRLTDAAKRIESRNG